MPDNPEKPRVVDNPDVSEVYVNKTIGCSFDGGAISVLVGCSRVVPEYLDTMPEQDQPPPVYVTGRLALSPAAAVELINSLNGILAAISNAPNSPISAFPGGGSAKPNESRRKLPRKPRTVALVGWVEPLRNPSPRGP